MNMTLEYDAEYDASPFDRASSVLKVLCLTFDLAQNSRNSALENCVPLSDNNSSSRLKSQKNLDISAMIADDVVDFKETTHGALLYQSTSKI